jgi:hypothetical protein
VREISIEESRNYLNPPLFVLDLIKVYQGVYTNKKALTLSEEKFFVCLVLSSSEGISSYKNSRFKQICKDLLGIERDSDVTTYLRRLQEEGWLNYDVKNKTFEIPEFFQNVNLKNTEVEVSVRLKLSRNA